MGRYVVTIKIDTKDPTLDNLVTTIDSGYSLGLVNQKELANALKTLLESEWTTILSFKIKKA